MHDHPGTHKRFKYEKEDPYSPQGTVHGLNYANDVPGKYFGNLIRFPFVMKCLAELYGQELLSKYCRSLHQKVGNPVLTLVAAFSWAEITVGVQGCRVIYHLGVKI